ncbi:phosphate ABC transporter permease PstA [Nitrolancea hollandica]|uniref:Phosphate transport system permease protein PstA n=1 Tax=Nitrolancea hollandica Lb TaxID=1129897 RepID=I4ED69_9BACT|nr:phosphate ABC transporter permease PstA [Nitrolancea hollandica]CCF82631.1 Phosphate transport system permease protein pstA [Nitrolancea hollandica Lb]
MIGHLPLRRRLIDRLMLGIVILLTVLALLPLGFILIYVVIRALPALNLGFFTQTPEPLGMAGGGMLNAIVGTLLLVGMASLMAIPVSILTGIYLSEHGSGRFANIVRLLTNTMAGVPSIAAGLFAYTLVVLAMGGFSAFSGSVALAILMMPVMVRATEEGLRMVPRELREGALALGIPQWKATIRVILPTALSPIVTGILLSVARASGEAAPLLFTAFGSPFLTFDPTHPIAALPLQIFVYATAPYKVSKDLAWTGALTLVVIVLITSLLARLLATRHR